MRQLIIIRHAKAEDGGPGMKDIDRSLTKKGVNDAYDISEKVRSHVKGKTLLVSSPANRAFGTAGVFADAIGYNRAAIRLESGLWESDVETHLEVIRSTDDNIDTLLIFGHDPTFSMLATFLAGRDMRMAKSEAILFEYSGKWATFGRSETRMVSNFSPKNL